MKKNNLIALIVLCVFAVALLLWKSGVFKKSGKKEDSSGDNENAGSTYVSGLSVSRVPQNADSADLYQPKPSVSGVSIPRISRNESYDANLSTLNSPEMLVNYGKLKR